MEIVFSFLMVAAFFVGMLVGNSDGGGEFSDAWNEYREEVLRNLK